MTRLPTRLVLCAVLLWLVVMALEWQLRRGPSAPAQALTSPAQLLAADTTRASMQTMQRSAGGTIPMPANTPSAHASSLLVMPQDSAAVLSAFWFAGQREGAPDVQIAASQFDRASARWLPARFVVNRAVAGDALGFGLRRLGNPVAWTDATGRIHLFVVATGLGGWAAGRVLHLVQSSTGNGLAELAFEPVRVMPLSWLWNTSFLVRSAPLPLADGGMVLPVYFELGIKYPVALRFDAQGNFVSMVRMSRRQDILQPALLAMSPTHWVALLRESGFDAHIAALQTFDGGAHWSDLPDLPLVNPDASVAVLTLSAQQHVMVHNTSPHSRALLDLSRSTDGLQWSPVQALERGNGGDEYSYPAMAWADGSLWVSYTDHRTHIAWQRFKPALAASGAAP